MRLLQGLARKMGLKMAPALEVIIREKAEREGIDTIMKDDLYVTIKVKRETYEIAQKRAGELRMEVDEYLDYLVTSDKPENKGIHETP